MHRERSRSKRIELAICAALAACTAGCATTGLWLGASSGVRPSVVRVLPLMAPGYLIDGVVAGTVIARDEYTTVQSIGLGIVALDALVATILLVDQATAR